ncbi:homocysteine S-methyltransferase family protein [Sphingosinicella rhizophila]|uniref:Homocysteine S-methyltransferase family protein n=1 Tax=Sphingosinicella rhizophila TaxID=3050082 RepID=A0ABU3Q9V1_9SPHN|nr:homocysteine S-methyltransferase family protein [Sphingosinicella sp. GR2756]MDT9600174.1 homocysteine S-methyltransferase family protein [Sphingosinicella sp. GR2756]
MTFETLPQLSRPHLADGGLETDFIFNRGVDLPCFSSIVLLRDQAGRDMLDDYFNAYIGIARRAGAGLVLESPTWRASSDWAERIGLSQAELEQLNAEAISHLRDLRARNDMPIVVSGCIGPRGDGYDPGEVMTVDEAHRYHARQAQILAAAGADLISGLTITNVPEAIGIARAAEDAGAAAVISFTVETDGRLPTGEQLGSAIAAVDEATDGSVAYFMVNCAHPSHFADTLRTGESWTQRLGGVRANASRCSHAELEAMTDLDEGDPEELGREYRMLREQHPQLMVLGGCCGTDHRHITAIAEACLAAPLADGENGSDGPPSRRTAPGTLSLA